VPSIGYDVIHAAGRCKLLGSVELPDLRSSAHRKAGRLEEMMVANGNDSLASRLQDRVRKSWPNHAFLRPVPNSDAESQGLCVGRWSSRTTTAPCRACPKGM